mgnify:CR=1 FL=1
MIPFYSDVKCSKFTAWFSMTSDALLQEERKVQSTLATLGADHHALQHQTRCLENLKNFTKIRLGNIIDADMAQASIEYEASQVKKD